MTRFTRLLALLAIAAALVAVGCGDDDDDEGASTTTTEEETTDAPTAVADSKEQWIATADEVCANADREIERAVEQFGLTRNSTPQEIAGFYDSVVIPVQQTVIDTLRGLAPPDEEADQINGILVQLQDAVDTVADDPELQADPEAAEAEFDAVDQAAQDYGLQECGSE